MRVKLGATLALALILCANSTIADDISNWSTTDANNNRTPPNGWPSGTMAPSQVEPTGRSIMGAIARWYALMGGSNSAGVANTTAVRAATTASYPNGFFRLTDGAAGAPPLRYVPDTNSACSADDGGSCIAASGGGYFIAQFPGNVADIREFGAVGDNTTNNATVLQAAFSWAAANNGTLYIPAKEFYDGTGINVTVPASGSLTVVGPGQLRFAAAVANGIIINVTGSLATIHLRDFSVLTSGNPATGAGIYLHQATASLPDPAATLVSDITNVTVRGADTFGGIDYFTYGIFTDYVSNLLIKGYSYSGAAQAGTAIDINGGANANQIGVIYNITDANLFDCNYGIVYGPYIQGMTVTHSNFTGINYGIFTSNATDASQLNVSDSQFATYKSAIDDAAGINSVNVHNNLFLPLNAGANASVIFSLNAHELVVADNIINGGNINDGFSYNAVAVGGGDSASTGVIKGNAIANISAGVVLGSGAQGLRVSDNEMKSVTTPYSAPASPTAITNSISANVPAFVGVSNVGATGLSPNYIQLTVTGTSTFYNGEWVCVQGTTAGTDPFANICTTISITDSTHIVLQGITASGSSTASGGIVSAIP